MSFDSEENRWMCGRVGAVKLNSIIREIREPCLHRSPTKLTKMLKPEKWQAIFDSDGKALGFKKALKMIVWGGVDPSIRAEVWEFLLGCYAISTTTEYRSQLRMARRERYMDLIKECQKMHSSVGTGTLAYVVGSKLMDMRTSSKENDSRDADSNYERASYDVATEVNSYPVLNFDQTDTSPKYDESSDPISLRGSTDSGPCYGAYKEEADEYEYFDFPPLPVTNLFRKADKSELQSGMGYYKQSYEQKFGLENGSIHRLQTDDNVDLVMESCGSPSNDGALQGNGKLEMVRSNGQEHCPKAKDVLNNIETVNQLRITGIHEGDVRDTSSSLDASEDKVSEWLWTLHRIVVDVVRTDSHLEFYGDSKNMARMSDILAVYAWVDPSTGYCQGMSDLLSPFLVLYEDNADAFWCFEMLLRRLRENFHMEGPIGVMKQLQALWKILELTDTDIFLHLSVIGAESLHFAFRMLLVLFRRELSFNDALCMWEMMWAADFSEAISHELEMNCLEKLDIQLPRNSGEVETVVDCIKSSPRHSTDKKIGDKIMGRFGPINNGMKLVSSYPLCGLATSSFWARNERMPTYGVTVCTKNGDDDLSVFCVAAILISNRRRIIQLTNSLDDLIKASVLDRITMFNDKMLKINVKKCIRMAIRLRKKYFYKVIRTTALANSQQVANGRT